MVAALHHLMLVFMTLTTIGYGAVIAMIFGACYTAMPFTLVGSQFNKSYREHKRREALLRTKLEVGKPYMVQQHEFELWTEFAANEGFTNMLRRVSDELDPLVDETDQQESIEDGNREAIVELATLYATCHGTAFDGR